MTDQNRAAVRFRWQQFIVGLLYCAIGFALLAVGAYLFWKLAQ